MNALYSSLSIAAFIAAASPVLAQIDPSGEPLGYHRVDHGLSMAPVHVLPPVDVFALMAEDDARIAAGIKGPWRFGYDHATDLSMENSGVWSVLANGDRVWQLGIECPGALSINIEFHSYLVPEGARVFVYNTLNEHYGPYTAATNGGRTSMGVGQLPGDRITIEYHEPAAVAGEGALRIGQVTHAYRDVLGLLKGGFNGSGSCNNNVICPEGDPWRDQIRSVAMITAGGGLCTGQLLNNCANDSTPYFLTANHCYVAAPNVGNWVFRFRWESPTCTPTTNTTGLPKNINGSTLLVNSAGSDVALLELDSRPPSSWAAFYSGWDNTTTPATSVTAIHHPSGDIKKISFEEQAVTSQNFQGAQCWRVAAWDDGTTEGGSSGSGLWNQNGLLVGQLFGGQANCSNNVNDYYGKFSVSYPLLDEYLGGCGTVGGLNPAAGLEERNGTISEFSVSPNPSSGQFTISWTNGATGASEITVLDPVGRVVRTLRPASGVERVALDLGDQADGLYLIELRRDGQRSTERLVLHR